MHLFPDVAIVIHHLIVTHSGPVLLAVPRPVLELNLPLDVSLPEVLRSSLAVARGLAASMSLK